MSKLKTKKGRKHSNNGRRVSTKDSGNEEVHVYLDSGTGRFLTRSEAEKLSHVFRELADYDKAKAQ